MKLWEAIKHLEETGEPVAHNAWDPNSRLVLCDAAVTYKYLDQPPRVLTMALRLSGKWCVYKGPSYDWVWAREQLEAGKTVKRLRQKTPIKLMSNPGLMSIFVKAEADGSMGTCYNLQLEDLDAEDWVLA